MTPIHWSRTPSWPRGALAKVSDDVRNPKISFFKNSPVWPFVIWDLVRLNLKKVPLRDVTNLTEKELRESGVPPNMIVSSIRGFRRAIYSLEKFLRSLGLDLIKVEGDWLVINPEVMEGIPHPRTLLDHYLEVLKEVSGGKFVALEDISDKINLKLGLDLEIKEHIFIVRKLSSLRKIEYILSPAPTGGRKHIVRVRL